MKKIIFVGPSAEIEFQDEPDPCLEEEKKSEPDPVANYNYNCQKRSDDC